MRGWVEVTEARGGEAPPPSLMEAIRLDAEETEALRAGEAFMAMAPLIRGGGRPVKANLSLDSGVLAAIDAAAEARGVMRSALVERLAKRGLPELA
jgi:hypothetical protein